MIILRSIKTVKYLSEYHTLIKLVEMKTESLFMLM